MSNDNSNRRILTREELDEASPLLNVRLTNGDKFTVYSDGLSREYVVGRPDCMSITSRELEDQKRRINAGGGSASAVVNNMVIDGPLSGSVFDTPNSFFSYSNRANGTSVTYRRYSSKIELDNGNVFCYWSCKDVTPDKLLSSMLSNYVSTNSPHYRS